MFITLIYYLRIVIKAFLLIKIMIFNNDRDWKKNLSKDAEADLNELLEEIAKHRGAFRSASDVKTAQLWCGLLETNRKMDKLNRRLERIENLLDGLFERYEKEKSELLKSLRKF